jgi:hypothetical protein
VWGHLVGGRHKSIVIDETADDFSAVVDDVHLHPVRAGLLGAESGLELDGITRAGLRGQLAHDARNVMVAERIASTTTLRLDWIRAELGMGSRSHCSRLISEQRKRLVRDAHLRRKRNRLLESAKANA